MSPIIQSIQGINVKVSMSEFPTAQTLFKQVEEKSPYQDKSQTSISSISIDVKSKTNTRPSSTLRNNLNDYGIKDFKRNKNSKLIKQLINFINNDKCLS